MAEGTVLMLYADLNIFGILPQLQFFTPGRRRVNYALSRMMHMRIIRTPHPVIYSDIIMPALDTGIT